MLTWTERICIYIWYACSEYPRRSFFRAANFHFALDRWMPARCVKPWSYSCACRGSDAYFSSALFVHKVDTKNIWETFVHLWVTMYTEYPAHIHLDQGSAFNSVEWVALCSNASNSTSSSGTESHGSLGQGETYYALRRRVYNKVCSTSANFPVKCACESPSRLWMTLPAQTALRLLSFCLTKWQRSHTLMKHSLTIGTS